MIFYSDAHSYIVPHLARCYIRTWNFYQDFWDYTPFENTSIFIEDFSDWSNGGATAVPRNFVYISMSPYMYVFEVAPASERMSLLMHHELTHVVAMDMSSKTDRFFRNIFGGKVQHIADNPISIFYAYLTTPRKYAPRWYHEGIAVSMETWMSGGIGRALGSYDEMVFRSMVRDSTYIYHMVGLESEGTAIDFQVGANSYLYGTRFFNYLAQKYGPQKLIEWVTRDDESKAYFSCQFKQVYNTKLKDEWSRWIEFEKGFQYKNLAKISQNPVTEINPITDKTLGSVSRSFYDKEKGKLYTGLKYPGQVAHLAEIDVYTGKINKICDVKGASTYFTCSLVWDETNEKLYFTTDNFYRRDLNVVDLKTGKSQKLITDIRAGELAMNKVDFSIWGVRHENGISTLIRIDPPYTDWTAIHAFPYGSDIYDLDISPDGTKLTGAITHIDGSQELACFDLKKLAEGEVDYYLIFDFKYSSPANFVFSPNGRYLYGTSYYSGVSNVYRYEFEIDDMCILSNCETGFFRPVPCGADSLIVFNYVGGKGWVPGWIKDESIDNVSAIQYLGQTVIDKYPIVKTWTDGSPAKINLDSLTTYKGTYKNSKHLHLNAAYPIVEGYKNYAAFGYRFNICDDIGFHRFDLTASYTPIGNALEDEERLHLNVNYAYKNLEFSTTYNHADFYDLVGPTKVSRKGYSLGISYDKNLIYDLPRTLDLNLSIKGFGGLDVLPDFQNVTFGYDKILQGEINLIYEFVKKSLGFVDEEKGIKFSLSAPLTYVNSELYPKFYSTLDLGFTLPLNHSSIWLRNAFGASKGNRSDSFASYYFGGFGNNYIDHKNEKRYREYYSFPGVEIDEIGGLNFAKSLLELNLPPIRFRQVGTPWCYVRWVRTALFGSGIVTDIDSENLRTYYLNLGAQIDFEMVILSLLKTTFSAGYAIARDEKNNYSEEIMISLKIL